ncbi:MAG: uracil-DNA glycosylase [Planctomycetes bacterium]|nr:uracil-DNA glycosylase [Planctomycetota bacterium]NUQ34812.1 uracil-DNA glycosylase [Planctomycetaceae bacterium]
MIDTPHTIAENLRKKLQGMKNAGVNDLIVDKKAAKLATMAKQKRIKNDLKAAPSKAAPSQKTINAGAVFVESQAAKKLGAYGGERAKRLAQMARDVANCAQCQLCSVRTQTVYSRGNPNSPLMFIGEAPGADEDAQGFPFVGRAGKLLDDIVAKGMQYNPDDVYICNVLKCRPPNNRNPEPDEIEACRSWLEAQIEIIDPVVIVAWGKFSAQWLLQSDAPIGKLRGRMWDVGGRKVVCTYHPAYLLRTPSAKTETWKDVQIVMDYFGRGKPLPMRV